MCHRINCDCTVQKPLDEFYASCFDCGALIELTIEVKPMPAKYVRKGTAIKEFCVHGHARTPDNVTKRGACITCQRIKDAARSCDPAYKAYQKAYRGKAILGWVE